MSLAPLISAPLAIQLHACVAVVALLLGVVQLVGAKGTSRHRALGYAWVAAMVIVAASSFWIHEIRQFGDFSLIHLLSIWVLISLPMAVASARAGRISAHRAAMRGMFYFGLVLAGLLTLIPGRLTYAVLVGS